MPYQPISNREQWNDTLLQLPARHVLQSWDWGQVKQRHGWEPTRLLWTDQGRPVAAAQVLRRALPHTPWGMAYVPKGPALDYTQETQLQGVLADLEEWTRRSGAILCKIDPDDNLPSTAAALSARGWRYSAEQIQFRNTALLDLRPSLDDLLAAMKSKTRYNVRLSKRKGVTVRAGTVEDIPCFYGMYAETGTRDGFIIRPFEYYAHAWGTFLQAGLAHMLLAAVEDQNVAGMILFRLGDKAWYMYGASTDQHRNLMPNYALQWAAIRWAKSVGCSTYDLWGAPDVLDERDRMWGVWRFKEGLGAQFTPHIGAFDYPARPLLYRTYSAILPKYLGFLRRRHQEGN